MTTEKSKIEEDLKRIEEARLDFKTRIELLEELKGLKEKRLELELIEERVGKETKVICEVIMQKDAMEALRRTNNLEDELRQFCNRFKIKFSDLSGLILELKKTVTFYFVMELYGKAGDYLCNMQYDLAEKYAAELKEFIHQNAEWLGVKDVILSFIAETFDDSPESMQEEFKTEKIRIKAKQIAEAKFKDQSPGAVLIMLMDAMLTPIVAKYGRIKAKNISN